MKMTAFRPNDESGDQYDDVEVLQLIPSPHQFLQVGDEDLMVACFAAIKSFRDDHIEIHPVAFNKIIGFTVLIVEPIFRVNLENFEDFDQQ